MYALNVKSPAITGGLNPLAIKESGVYKGIILTAFDEPRDDGKRVIRILFQANEVFKYSDEIFVKFVKPKFADLWLFLTNKQGNVTKGYTHLKELCNLCNIGYLDTELADVPIFAPASGKFKSTPREQFSDLVNQKIIFDLRAERRMGLRYDYLLYSIVKAYDAKTLQTSDELEQSTKAKAFYKKAII